MQMSQPKISKFKSWTTSWLWWLMTSIPSLELQKEVEGSSFWVWGQPDHVVWLWWQGEERREKKRKANNQTQRVATYFSILGHSNKTESLIHHWNNPPSHRVNNTLCWLERQYFFYMYVTTVEHGTGHGYPWWDLCDINYVHQIPYVIVSNSQ